MVRNTMKVIEQAKGIMNLKYEMHLNNVLDVRDASEDIYDMIFNGFHFGYMQGMKAAKAEMERGGVAV